VCVCARVKLYVHLERQPQEPWKCLHHDLEKNPSVMLEYFSDLLYITREGTLLKMILTLAIHHLFTFKEIISHACDSCHKHDCHRDLSIK
jgi:hypothetical protein